ncbi:MAG: DUF86 domain-containing protein [Acidobacteriota bacterium]
MRPRSDTILLADMLDYGRRAVTAIEGRSRQELDADPVLVGALERFVEVIGEAANRLTEETRRLAPGVPWNEIIAMRNRLVHGYFAVDLDILWTVVHDDLPGVIDELDRLVTRDADSLDI